MGCADSDASPDICDRNETGSVVAASGQVSEADALADEGQPLPCQETLVSQAEMGCGPVEAVQTLAEMEGIASIQAPHVESATQTPIIQGSFDDCRVSSLWGWVWDSQAPECRLEVEIICDGQLIGRLIADEFRSDLIGIRVGDGRYGFRSVTPEALLDGKKHVIAVREVSTGLLLHGSPKTFQADFACLNSRISLEGSVLAGSANFPARVNVGRLRLEVVEGTQVISMGQGTPDGSVSHRIHFRLPLPMAVFDGRPHRFSVRGDNPIGVIGDVVLITPHVLTPETALQQYAREGLKSRLAVMAGFRYESLVKQLEQFAGCRAGEGSLPQQISADLADLGLGKEFGQIVGAHARLVRGVSETGKDFDRLVFPEVNNPRVSIVIPMHNKFPTTYHCLASLLVAANCVSFEVILVDDGSQDETTQIPTLIKGVGYIRNDEAQGFVLACNRGGELARGEYIVMLNNDTEVTSHWLDELLWPFEHFDQVGLTGAKLLYPDGTLQEAGGIVWNTGDPWNYGRQANPFDPRYNYTRQVDYLSGACLMLPRRLWNALGGFNEAFVPAYFEDTDLAFRVRDQGYKTVYTPFAQVAHFEGISSGTSTASGVKRYQEINRPKFKQRWASSCRHNGKPGIDLELNKDRNIEFRALVLDAETPMPDKNAGSYAAIQEMRMLQRLGCKCTFVPQNLAWMGHYTEALQRMGVECLYLPFAGSINEVIEKRGSEFDLIYITRYYVAQHYLDLIRQYAPQARIVLMDADLHFLRELRTAVRAKNREALARALETRDAELATMRKVELVLSYTDVEKAVILSHNLDSTRVAKCPWVAEVVSEVPAFDRRADIAFLGGYGHHPNAEAVEWFAGTVMPLLRTALPGVRFRVYGSNVPKRLLALAEKNEDVVIEGWVPAVGTAYNACRVFIAPLQNGAGIKGKVIAALAHGVPCVLSPLAAEGIPISNGVNAWIANKPEEWVTAIVELYNNPEAWMEMSKRASALAVSHYGFAKGVAEMREALQQAEIFTTTENRALALQ